MIVTYDGMEYTRMCLGTLLANTEFPNYEVIVVDNGSQETTRDYLRSLSGEHDHVRVIYNQQNKGFAPANNQGMAWARGEVLVLLNNDTLVPPGWLSGLVRHLADPEIGFVGPVTNRSGNQSQIDVPYQTYGEFLSFAADYTGSHPGERTEVQSLTMFCLAMNRKTYERLGPLDERFELGLFEDEDYCLRARQAGFRLVCAEDVFVHHFGQGSIGKLASQGLYGRLFHANRRRFEEKWNISWESYPRRLNLDYQNLVSRLRARVADIVPDHATVIVVSKGDAQLLDLSVHRAWHFPQERDGTYAGYYPADSEAAISHLEELRTGGAEFLILPCTAFWWLEHYAGFGAYLARYRLVVNDEDTCRIYELYRADENGNT